MRRLATLCSLLLISLAFPNRAATAQNSQSYLNDLGNTAYGVNIPVENGFINISNGNLHLEFPLASHPQRGALALNERLTYDSRIWEFLPFGSNGSYHWWPYNVPGTSTTSGGWQFVTGAEIGAVSYTQIGNSSTSCASDPESGDPGRGGDGDVDRVTTFSIAWTDPSGTLHPFNATLSEENSNCPSNPFYQQIIFGGSAVDGSGYSVKDDGSGNPLVIDNNGTQVSPQIIDRYGNYWSTDGQGNLMDAAGRVPVIKTPSGNVTYYDVLAPNGPIQNNGTRVRYTVTIASIPVSTNFQPYSQSDIYPWNPSIQYLTPVQSIVLPDGSQYTFGYDGTGELNSVTLPTGGVIHYGYGNFIDSSSTENRWLTSRTIDSNPAMTFTPSVVTTCANYSTGCVEQVNLHKSSGDETVYQMTLVNGAWNTGTTTYTGSASNGQKLSQTTGFNTYTNGCSGTAVCHSANYLSQSLTTTALFSNPSTSAVYSQTLSVLNSSVGKVADVKEWGYVSTSPSTTTPPTTTPTRETQYTYTGNDPSQVTVLSNGVQAGQTTYGYTTTATATSNVPQHGTQNAGGPYLQTVAHWLNTGSSPTTNATMDDTGQLVSSVDAKSNPATVFSYQCANSLPYQVTNALNQTTTYGYDCSSGAMVSVKDPNDAAAGRAGTVYAYEATAGRPYTVTSPDGGVTTYSYPSSTEVDTTVLATPNPSIASQDIVDSFGRKYQHVQAGVSTETSYDANGRPYCTANPHGGSASATDGSTCVTSYDGLDRPLVQQQPDGHTLGWAYNGPTVTSTDENGNQWQRTSDSFGHLTTVVEPGSLATTYTYDGLGNIRTVSQAGNGSTDSVRTRSFTYDSMSRLLCESHPESSTAQCPATATASYISGTTGYGYDPNGNQTSKTDARNVTVASNFDALNRLHSRTGPGGLNYVYAYDETQNANFTVKNGIGRLTGTSNQVNADSHYSYDAMGRLVHQEGCTPQYVNCGGGANPVYAAYDLAGQMTSLTYPDGRAVSQNFDGAGRMYGVNYASWGAMAINTPYLTVNTFAPASQPTTSTLGNGVQVNTGYTPRLQLASLSYANGNGNLWSKNLSWYPNGNLELASDNILGISRQYKYDPLNRLSSAQDIMGTSSNGGQTGGASGGGSGNALQNSQQLGAVGWNVADATMVANTVAAPDGSMTAGVVTVSGSASADAFFTDSVPDPALYDGATVVGSVWLKVPSGTLSTSIFLINVGDQYYGIAGQSNITLTTSWQQFQVAGTNQNGLSQLSLQVGGGHSFTSNQIMDVWAPALTPVNTSSASLVNILTSPQQIGGSGWGMGSGSVAANSALAPDGTTNAAMFTANANAVDAAISASVVQPAPYSNTAVSASVWLRLPDGSPNLTTSISIINTGSNYFSTPAWLSVTLTTSWQKFQVSGVTSANVTGLYLQVGGSQSITHGQVFHLWGAEMHLLGTPGATNILPSSQQVMGSSWGNANVAPSLSAPDNTYTATQLNNTGSGETYYDVFAPNPAPYSGQTVTGSIYLRVPDGHAGQNFNLYLGNIGANGFQAIGSAQVGLTTTWQRFQVTGTNQASLSYLWLQIGGGGSFASGQSIEVWGAQMVVGTQPGAYVPTTTATTTGPDGTPETLVADGLNEAYSYDSFGNLQQSGNFNFVQTYTAANRISGYSYDAAGNMLSDGLTNTLQYDANGMVSWDSGTTYTYNPMGERVGKSGGGTAATDTVYFGGRPLARLSNGAWTDFVYGPAGLLAEVPGTQNGAPVYRMTDHLGSTVGLLSASGTAIGSQDTVPFGQLLPGGGAQDTQFPFTELEHDSESGFDHASFRQYASTAGRWMSPDPYDGSMDLGNPQSLNRYAYVGNNPLLFTDPTGLDGGLTITVLAICGHVSGACAGGFTNPISAIVLGSIFAGAAIADFVAGFFAHPTFNGSLQQRPDTPKKNCPVSSSSIDNYLGTKASPMVGEGADFMATGAKFNLDPRLLVSLSGAETGFGSNITAGQFNALNVLWGHPRLNSPYPSFQANINAAGKSLTNPANGYDLSSTSTLYKTYCYGNCKAGLNNVNNFMSEQGANKNSLRNPCSHQ